MKFFENILSIIALWILTIFNEFFVDKLSLWLNITDSWILFLFVLIMSLLLFYFFYKRKKFTVDISVDVLKEDFQKEEKAHRGLVIILSAFSPFKDLAKFKQENPEKFKEAMEKLDIDTLMLDDVSQSNFGPPVVALRAHKTKLEHVWLICSKSSTGKKSQSIDYAPLIEKYIHKKINPTVNVHYGDSYAVLLDEDSFVCRQSFKIVKKIYKEAKKYGLKSKDLITDVTGGIKPLNTGAILACLNRDEDIQVIGTAYDDDGKYKGEPFPMIIEYKPSLLEID